jgi:hypothetical protein
MDSMAVLRPLVELIPIVLRLPLKPLLRLLAARVQEHIRITDFICLIQATHTLQPIPMLHILNTFK